MKKSGKKNSTQKDLGKKTKNDDQSPRTLKDNNNCLNSKVKPDSLINENDSMYLSPRRNNTKKTAPKIPKKNGSGLNEEFFDNLLNSQVDNNSNISFRISQRAVIKSGNNRNGLPIILDNRLSKNENSSNDNPSSIPYLTLDGFNHPNKEKPFPMVHLNKSHNSVDKKSKIHHKTSNEIIDIFGDDLSVVANENNIVKDESSSSTIDLRDNAMLVTFDLGNLHGKSKTGLGEYIEGIETKVTWQLRTNYFQNAVNYNSKKNKDLEREFF